MKTPRITDLTRRLSPGEPTNSYGWKRTLKLERMTFPSQPTQIAHDFTMNSHLGTHVETPSHMMLGAGMNVADFAPETFIGEAVLAEVTHRAPRGSISAQDLETATEGKVQRGDILLIWGHYKPEDRPSISLDAAQWIVAHGFKLIGFDSVDGIDPDAHDLILGNNIPMLEEIVNLENVQGKRAFLVALPIPIVGLDACPVRAVALEGLS